MKSHIEGLLYAMFVLHLFLDMGERSGNSDDGAVGDRSVIFVSILYIYSEVLSRFVFI